LGIQPQYFDHAACNQGTVLTGITSTFFVTLCVNNVSDLMFIFKYRKMQPIDTVLYCLYCCAVDYKTEDCECCIFEPQTLNFITILPCVLCM